MKQQILSEINSKLSALGIRVQNGNGADISISTEFLDAGWNTGNKKISYEASIFANEQENVIYMYEKTTEVGQGISFGGESESSFQSGMTLFRKVKSIQYGIDGKAYEYTLDLGAITKTVKETAKRYGWKFKIVLNKDKAMYPAGYVQSFVPTFKQAQPVEQPLQTNGGFCSNCGMQLAQGARFCDKCGKPVGNPTSQTAVPPYVPHEQPQPNPINPQPQYGNPQGAFYSAAPKKTAE
ncbi:MAG TPA: zinc ribbon domain-containing protein [Oscillospiraceae bacterium]|nr:zinc ribbon domain-containing protein [Oscillospiraceae bacterium]